MERKRGLLHSVNGAGEDEICQHDYWLVTTTYPYTKDMINATTARGDCPNRRITDSIGSGLRTSGISDMVRLSEEGVRASSVIGFSLGSTKAVVCSNDGCTGVRANAEGPIACDE